MSAALTTDQWISIAAAFGQVAAALLAVIALIISIATSRSQQKLAQRIAGDEHAMLFEQIRNQRDSDIIQWSQACVQSLSEIECHVAFLSTGDCSQRRVDLMARLSALIDHGRLFFPNEQPHVKGAEKPAAFQGFRQKILTVLVSAYNVIARDDALHRPEERERARSEIMEVRREFISEAQLAIDPRRFLLLKEMNEIRAGRGLKPQSFEGADPAERFKRS